MTEEEEKVIRKALALVEERELTMGICIPTVDYLMRYIKRNWKK